MDGMMTMTTDKPAVLVTGVVAGFAAYNAGSSAGKKQMQKAEIKPSDAVKVYTLGGPGSDFPSLPISPGTTCLSGPPFLPGTPTYQSAQCSSSHDLELYYQTALITSTFSQYGANGNGPIPYPGVDQLTALAKQMCWTDRLIGPWANPKGSHYNYYALIPSNDLWNGQNLPSDWTASQDILCVMTNNVGQLPGDVSH